MSKDGRTNLEETGAGFGFFSATRYAIILLIALLCYIPTFGSIDTIATKTANRLIYDYEKYPSVQKFIVGEEEFEEIRIGDTIPQRIMELPLWAVNHPMGVDTGFLKDFDSSELLVLDFWSTWCAPCIRSMDGWNDYLQNNSAEITVLGVLVFDQAYKALPFSQDRGWTLTSVIGHSAHVLNRHFFTKYVNSRLVWIKDGKLVAITTAGEDNVAVSKILLEGDGVVQSDKGWIYN